MKRALLSLGWLAAGLMPGACTRVADAPTRAPGPAPVVSQRPEPCTDLTTADTCGADARCRWLEPGCGSGWDRPLSERGCYLRDDCDSGDCSAGLTCREVVVNPCAPSALPVDLTADGVTCLACGTEARVCLP